MHRATFSTQKLSASEAELYNFIVAHYYSVIDNGRKITYGPFKSASIACDHFKTFYRYR